MSDEHPLITKYRDHSPASQKLAERARSVFPGGDTRASAHYAPYPLSIASGSGAVLTDADGHELLDFMNNFTSLIHGHAHPEVVAAVREQAGLGSAYAAPSDAQIELAELITERIPSVDQLRFTSSGSEGTLMALRCARAATGRQKIMKMEGGYHGSYEQAEVSLAPLPGKRGELSAPSSTAFDASFPDSVLADTVICPFNEPEHARTLIRTHAHELAAVIVEPVLGSMGMVAATPEFLLTLREATAEHGVLLIFDEVITLRLSSGGAQAAHGISPDLTCLGKIIGGGLPIGAVGGKRDLMQLFSPDQAQPVMHASTFSGNALTMSAGLAAMKAYTSSEAERINTLGAQLRQGFNQVLQQSGVRAQAIGQGSLTNLHFTDAPIHDARDNLEGVISAGHIPALLHLGMLRRGVASASRLMYCTSTAMDAQTINQAIDALADTLKELRPHIEAERPQLLS